jgi:hypothetical protein
MKVTSLVLLLTVLGLGACCAPPGLPHLVKPGAC